MECKRRCVIVQHCAVLGRLETLVRWAKTVQAGSSVTVTFQDVGEGASGYCLIRPDNLRFVQIEAQGRVLWDSRQEVPCDMAVWAATNVKHREEREQFIVV